MIVAGKNDIRIVTPGWVSRRAGRGIFSPLVQGTDRKPLHAKKILAK